MTTTLSTSAVEHLKAALETMKAEPIAWAIVRADGSMCELIETTQQSAEQRARNYAAMAGASGYTVIPLYRFGDARLVREHVESALFLLETPATMHPLAIDAFFNDLAERMEC